MTLDTKLRAHAFASAFALASAHAFELEGMIDRCTASPEQKAFMRQALAHITKNLKELGKAGPDDRT